MHILHGMNEPVVNAVETENEDNTIVVIQNMESSPDEHSSSSQHPVIIKQV